MFENIISGMLIISIFVVGAGVLILLDFLCYRVFKVSFLCAIEKFLFERFGNE